MPQLGLDSARIRRMLQPQRIAVAGYSPRPEAWSNLLVHALRSGQFAGDVLALRPRSTPEGMAVIQGLDGEAVDLLVVALPAAAVPEVIAEAAQAGVAGCVVFSAGFAEGGAEGAELQRQLIEAAGAMPLIGPNSIGMVSGPGRMVATASPFAHRNWASNSPTAVVSQSGAVGFVLSEELKRHGIVPRYYTSVGNEAVISAVQLAAAHLDEPEITSLGLYLESITEPRELHRLGIVARERGATVTLLTSGTSSAGKRAAQSHTAAVVGDRLLLGALCDDAGIVVTGDEGQFAAALAMRARGTAYSHRPERVAVLSMSGGAGAIIADRLSDAGITVPELSESMVKAISTDFDFVTSAQNPVDLGGMFLRHLSEIGTLTGTIARSGEVDAVVLFLTNGQLNLDEYRTLGERLRTLAVPAWLVWAGAREGDLEQSGLEGVVLPSIGALRQGLEALASADCTPETAPEAQETTSAITAETLRLWDASTQSVMTESVARPILESLAAPYAETVDLSIEDAMAGHFTAPAYPVVIKGDSPQAPHRARLGLIRLGVSSGDELRAGIADLVRRIDELGIPRDEARILVQRQRTAIGDFSLGLLRDEDYGDFVVAGPGGADVERSELHRYAIPLPLTAARVSRLHRHAQRIAGVDIQQETFGDLATALGSLVELPGRVTDADLNPVLVVEGSDLVLVDSLLVVDRTPSPQPKESHDRSTQ
ncbi:acetate--CoA ligase family protein [Leifsonia bigeumensis]|uniref:Acetate--CoA ligase family protein n=1 Tax=Leifsonella bigeumensis TaxID=433643 RepID=A0ABP7F8N9_9MICO